MLVPVAVSKELKQTDTQADRIALYVLDNCSNRNYKPQMESHQQHLALYMKRHLHSATVMMDLTSCHTECTHLTLITARSLLLNDNDIMLHLSRCSWMAASSVKRHNPSSSRRILTSRPPSN